MFRNIQVFICAIIVLIIDRLSKLLVLKYVAPISKFVVFDKFFSFYYLENSGAAFSLLSGHIDFLKVFSLITVIGIIAYFIFSKREISMCGKIAWGLILGGSTGNLADRIIHGYVVDFISLDFLHFAVFNFADIAINVGVFILIICILKSEKRVCQNLKK